MIVNSGYANTEYKSYFTHENIEKTVHDGTYAMIESVSSEDAEISESAQNEKFALLGSFLADNQFPHRQITGSYEGVSTKFSFFVVKPEGVDLTKFRQIIFSLGKKFKQESVIFSSKEFVELAFTTGVNAGKTLTGQGFNSRIDRNFSEIITSDGKYYFIGEYYLDRHSLLKWSP
jgi:hypothetical protein